MDEQEQERQFAALWEDAVQTFFQTADKHLLRDHSLPDPLTVKDLIAQIDKEQQSFTAYREHKRRLYDTLGTILGPVSLLGKIAAGTASIAFQPSTLVFNAFNYTIECAENVSSVYDALCDLFEELSQFMTRLTVHERQQVPIELRGIVTSILCTLIRTCGYTTRLIRRGRIGLYLKGFALGKDNDIGRELAKLKQLTDNEARMVAALTLSVAMSTHDAVKNLSNKFDTLAVKIDENREESEKKSMQRLRLVLEPTMAPEELFRSISNKRVPGTGDWIRREPIFKSWLQRDWPILWVSGGPGAGKSYLTSNIIQLLLQIYPQGVQDTSRMSVAYYFCKDYDPELRSVNKALRTLAYQLCQNDPMFARHVAGIAAFPEDLSSTQSIWRRLFVDFFRSDKSHSIAYLLFDGVDEAPEPERAELLELLKDFQNEDNDEGKLRLQVLMLGRPELNYDMDQVLDQAVPVITVSSQKTSADISKYVVTKVSKDRNLRHLPDAFRTEIVQSLTRGADGMFLWVDLMLKEVSSKHREGQIRQALQKAPKGLYDTIRHTLERVSHELTDEDAADLNTLLAWVTCARRPFTLGELEDVTKLTGPENGNIVYLEGMLRKRHASFFTVNREDGRTTEDLLMDHSVEIATDDEETLGQHVAVAHSHDTGQADDFGEDMDIESDPTTTEVTLAHATFSSFFRQEKTECKVGVDVNAAELAISQALIELLCDKTKWNKFVDRDIAKYAVVQWQDHVRSIDLSKITLVEKSKLAQGVIKMFRDRDVVTRWGTGTWQLTLRQNWLYTEDNNSAIHALLTSASADLPTADQAWIRALYPKSEAEVTDELTKLLAEFWLRDNCTDGTNWTAWNSCYRWLKARNKVVKARRRGTELPTNSDPTELTITSNTVNEILEVARSVGFEEDSLWHSMVAWIMKEAHHYEAARLELDTALRLDAQRWQPHNVLAELNADQKRYSAAIKAMQKCLQLMEAHTDCLTREATKSFYVGALGILGGWQKSAGRDADALATFQKVQKMKPRDFLLTNKIVGLLWEDDRYDEGMQMYRRAKEAKVSSTGNSELTTWCLAVMWDEDDEYDDVNGFYEPLVGVCRELGKMEFTRETYETALKAVKKADIGIAAWLNADYGRLLLEEFDKPRKAARIFEKVMAITRNSRQDTTTFEARLHVEESLSNIYLKRALQGGKDSHAAEESMVALSEMWTTSQSSTALNVAQSAAVQQIPPVKTTRRSSLILALLYNKFGRERKAREIFREHIRLGVDLLTDSDPSNDWQGYSKLGETLIRAGDEQGAIAAMVWESPDDEDDARHAKALADANGAATVMTEAQTESPKQTESSADKLPAAEATELDGESDDDYVTSKNEVSATKDDWWNCDGTCGKYFRHAGDLYLCRYCLGPYSFEQKCYELLKKDKLPINVCGHKHEFLHLPKVPRPMPRDMVWLGGKYVPAKEWLAQLKRDWEL